ncbi:MAG: SufB/SufD family protein [Methanosphaera sp.]|uniref:SufB/SufD family protein n=1 Tax=Methanosphaera TaxID=2316 RepID=UPI002380874D|nr:SufD family Fe-S cluster assembly protein [Candidatus Methanosphaera massiliense]MDD6285254.1 SufD family Fe-S cluster assembly protein [Methanobacteriaceae archaeon]MDE4078274.1 SufD family Fe-S cluster assembly protein [Candidatus Methanosphaera massiliense]MDY2745226.1 SufD family Fe-S cluster assembly protein [Methanosphaera sp.]
MVSFKDRAEKAIDKKASVGADVDLDEFEAADVGQYDHIDSLEDLTKDDQKTLNSVGMETDEKGRAASFLQMDQSEIFVNNMFPGVEVMGTAQALDKYDWLKDYMWKAVQVDADKYTATTELGARSGYFIRSEPNTKLDIPIQACMYIGDDEVRQTAHNIIIAEENSEINIITGCSTATHVDNAAHIGVSEFYLKKGAKVTFTMVHNWAKEVDVRPRTGVIMDDNSTYISNYILAHPVRNLQAYPTAYANGKNCKVFFQSILAGKEDSLIDQGSRTVLSGENSQSEMITRAISEDNSTIYTRGDLLGKSPDVRGHLECMGLILSDDSKIYSVPELRGESTNMELSHEAAVGKIAEDEIQYLMARGLTEDEAASMIVRGFLDIDIKGLPDKLAQETKKLMDMSMEGM